jgi:hypothetical protein
MIRLVYAHYLSAFFLTYMSLIHSIDMHYDWKNETAFDGLEVDLVWWDEALINEISSVLDLLSWTFINCWIRCMNNETLTYEIFMWGDVGIATDIRFYGVAPH